MPVLAVPQPAQCRRGEEPHALGGVGRVGERHVGGPDEIGRQAEPQVGVPAVHVQPVRRGRAVDVGEQGLVDVDDGGSGRRVHQRDRERGQVVVADEQQRGGGEVVLLVEPPGPPQRGLRGRGDVIEIAARSGRPVDPGDDRGQVVGALGVGRGRTCAAMPSGTASRTKRVAVAAGVEELQHRLDDAPRQPRLPDQAGQVVRALDEQHRHPRSPHRSGPEPGHEQIDEPGHRAIIPVEERAHRRP